MKKLMIGAACAALLSTAVYADCAYENTTQVKILSASFEAWKASTDAMGECGNFTAELDNEFRTKQPAALAASPALYHIGGVSNGTITPLLNEGTIRPLDDLVAQYGQDLAPNRLIQINGNIMAIAMMVNAEHLQYRADILEDLGLEVPTTYDEMLEAAAAIREAGVMENPIGGTFKAGWNIAQYFNNVFLGYGGSFYNDDSTPAVNSEAGVKALETMKALTEYMDPEYLGADSTVVQQQIQQGKIALTNFWASRAGAADDEAESTVVGLIETAAAPLAMEGGRPASTLWWDGVVIASNISDEEAAAAFQVALEGMDEEMVSSPGNNDLAVWLVQGYEPGRLAQGAIATADGGAPAYPSTTQMGLIHTAIGNNIPAYFTGEQTAEEVLTAVEAEYRTAATEAGLLQ